MAPPPTSCPTGGSARGIALAAICLAWGLGPAPAAAAAEPSPWIRAAEPDGPLVWGRRDGLVFGLPSPGGMPGPRGLIRVGAFDDRSGKPELINFVAVEPVVLGPGPRVARRALSEMEPSRLDPGMRGKRIWVSVAQGAEGRVDLRGTLTTLATRPAPTESLTVELEVEPFDNGARVRVSVRMCSDRPREVELSVRAAEGSAEIDELTLTATMGNYARLRQLWLKDRVVRSTAQYAGIPANTIGFIDGPEFPLEELLRWADGDAVVLATNDEEDPAAVEIPGARWWTYRSEKLTQYWRVPARHIEPDLRAFVNGRRVYWGSADRVPGGIEIPGGASFENFEVRQRYRPGQVFVFGLAKATPPELRPAIPRLGRPAAGEPAKP